MLGAASFRFPSIWATSVRFPLKSKATQKSTRSLLSAPVGMLQSCGGHVGGHVGGCLRPFSERDVPEIAASVSAGGSPNMNMFTLYPLPLHTPDMHNPMWGPRMTLGVPPMTQGLGVLPMPLGVLPIITNNHLEQVIHRYARDLTHWGTP